MNLPLASLSGRTAVVIGGTSVIGRVLALGLAAAGADVVASSRRVEQVESTVREIESLARRTLRIACDVCDRASLENLLTKTLETFGKVDSFVTRTRRRLWESMATFWETTSVRRWGRSNRYFPDHEVLFGTSGTCWLRKPVKTLGIW